MGILTKVGTRSLLFGCHQFLIHPVFVFAAWVRMYGWPTGGFIKFAIAIFVHDWGYWGCETMDGPCGDKHSERGAILVQRLTGDGDMADMVLLHSRFYAALEGDTPSMLCWADKVGTALYPSWLWALMAWASGEGAEYMANDQYEIHKPGEEATVIGLVKFHVRLRRFFAPLYRGKAKEKQARGYNGEARS